MFTYYTNKTIPEGFAGVTRGPFIWIRPQYRTDVGLLEHEKVHRKQWLRTFGLHPFFYLFSKKYKLKAEVEAYKEQLKYYTEDKAFLFASFIATKYNLDVSVLEAFDMLCSAS